MFDTIGTTNKVFVEFGVEDGTQCNTRLLRERHGWTGLQMDGSEARPEVNKQQEFITATNICALFRKYSIPQHMDLLSVDIDFFDYCVLRNILQCGYVPRVIIAEINASLGPYDALTVPCSLPEQTMWDGTRYYGMSLQAAARLLHPAYTLLYMDTRGINAFFVRTELAGEFHVQDAQFKAWVASLWRPPRNTWFGAHRPDPWRREFAHVE